MNQIYFNGDFYQVTMATNPGETPLTHPLKFALIKIPARWRWVLSKLAYANLLEMDGQKDKATVERASAVGDDRRGLDKLIRDEANREGFLGRPNVRERNFV